MSAYLVNPETMSAAVLLLSVHEGIAADSREDRLAKLTALGKELYAMNIAALRERYGSRADENWTDADQVAEDYKFHPVAMRLPMNVLAKQAACLRYQCSEGDVPETELYGRLSAVADACEDYWQSDEDRLANPWGIDDDDLARLTRGRA